MKSVVQLGMLAVVCSLTAWGCSKPASPTAVSDQSAATVPAGRPQGNGPDVAVFDFLGAVRTGNDEQASRMLSPLAREKVAQQHLVVAPPGTDTARFSVGKVEQIAEDGARVTVHWTDLDEDNKPRTDEVIWMVRHVEEGWRVAGVAAPVFDGEPPLLLNFEDPEDMLAKQKMVREEVRRRAVQADQAEGKQENTQAAQADGAVRR